MRVATIAPGLFDTPLLAGLSEEAKVSLGTQVPHPARLGDPSEFGALVAHIVANRCSTARSSGSTGPYGWHPDRRLFSAGARRRHGLERMRDVVNEVGSTASWQRVPARCAGGTGRVSRRA
jgi:hypothetical protein